MRCRAAVRRTGVVIRSEAADRQFGFVWENPFSNQLYDRPHESGMRPHSSRSYHCHPEFPRQIGRFRIEIVQDFHVIRKETEGRDENILHSPPGKLPQVIEDVRPEPRLTRRTTPALED